MFSFKKNGAIYFFRIGRFGGSFYLKKKPTHVHVAAPRPIEAPTVRAVPQLQSRIAFALRIA